jgi:hypothetical protein
MAQSTEQQHYECDPYTPGIYAERDPQTDFFANPLRVAGAILQADLLSAEGELVVASGERVVELGAAAPFHHFDRSLWSVQARIAELATGLETADEVLKGTFEGVVSDQDREALAQAFGTEVPAFILGHTRRSVGSIAVRDFGFLEAANHDTMPVRHLDAILAAGEPPMTIYMPMAAFHAIRPPEQW